MPTENLGNTFTFGILLLWIPFVLTLFRYIPVRRAILVSFLIAWLFLPQARFAVSGLPDLTKITATCYGILIGVILFDFYTLKAFRFKRIDIPIVIWCLCPFASSVVNGLGVYDGISGALSQTISWGVPYLFGRIYFSDLISTNKLATAMFWGGMIYLPLCLFEARFSPQLHSLIYGYFPHSFAQTIRLGGYRPQVFMAHGLEVGMYMMAASLIGLWLWHTGVLKQVLGMPAEWPVLLLFITFVMVKSTGAYGLLFLGMVILLSGYWFRTNLPLLLLVFCVALYVGAGAIGTVDRQLITSNVTRIVGSERAQSLDFRLMNEQILSEKARIQPVFGWGGYGRNRPGNVQVATDSLWIISFGSYGTVGLMSVMATLLFPSVCFCLLTYPARYWSNPKVAPSAALSVVLVLYMADSAVNSMFNPIFILANGAIAGIVQKGWDENFSRQGRAAEGWRSVSQRYTRKRLRDGVTTFFRNNW